MSAIGLTNTRFISLIWKDDAFSSYAWIPYTTTSMTLNGDEMILSPVSGSQQVGAARGFIANLSNMSGLLVRAKATSPAPLQINIITGNTLVAQYNVNIDISYQTYEISSAPLNLTSGTIQIQAASASTISYIIDFIAIKTATEIRPLEVKGLYQIQGKVPSIEMPLAINVVQQLGLSVPTYDFDCIIYPSDVVTLRSWMAVNMPVAAIIPVAQFTGYMKSFNFVREAGWPWYEGTISFIKAESLHNI